MLCRALCNAPSYRFDGEETRQLSVKAHGGGYGSIGPGSLTATGMWAGRARDGGAEKDAETRPVKATNSAKMRIAAFIFGNLMNYNVKGNRSHFPAESYLDFINKSIFFIDITN